MGAEGLKKRVGFPPYAFHKRFVFHRVLTRGLKLRPQALDEGQTLAAVIEGRTVSQRRKYAPKLPNKQSGFRLHQSRPTRQ